MEILQSNKPFIFKNYADTITVMINRILWLVAVILVLAGLNLPVSAAIVEFPISGHALLKFSLFADALFLIFLAIVYRNTVSFETLPQIQSIFASDFKNTNKRYAFLLIVLVACFLRFYKLNTDLWLDEIVTVNFSKSSFVDIFNIYKGANHHLLNTLLIKLSTGLFGFQDWAVRLPAAIFGILTVPVLFFLIRRTLGFWQSIGVIAILAVSYHHIFFTQNARGYVSHIFFSLLSTHYLLESLRTNRRKYWLFFVIFSFLNMASLINSAFVLMAHAIVCCVFVLQQQKNRLILINSTVSFIAIGLLAFTLYASIIPQFFVLIAKTYTQKSAGFNFFSLEFLTEMINGLLAGFGSFIWLGVIVFLVFAFISLLGYVSLIRRSMLLALALSLPLLLMFLYLVIGGLAVSPRFFLLGMAIAFLSLIEGVAIMTFWLEGRFLFQRSFSNKALGGFVVVLVILSLLTLPHYYSYPKQNYTGAIKFVEENKLSTDTVIAIHLTEGGIKYYRKKLNSNGILDNYLYIRDHEEFLSTVEKHNKNNIILITTLHRAGLIELPETFDMIKKQWKRVKYFKGTLGDGDLHVWFSKTRKN